MFAAIRRLVAAKLAHRYPGGMWICSQLGFFSIVRKTPGEFHIRARLRRDLVNLCEAVSLSMNRA